MKRASTVVIGAGVVGASIALELAKRRRPVVVLERHPRAGMGSTALSSAVIRSHYTWPEAIKLAREGRAGWEAHRGRARFHRTGVLFLHPRRGERGRSLGVKAEAAAEDLRALARTMTRLGAPAEALDRAALRKRFPFYRFDDRVGGLYEPDGGYVDHPAGAVEDLREAAERRGVRFEFNRRVTAIEDGRVIAGEVFPACAIVNAAGPHSSHINLLAGCPLPNATVPQRQFIIEAVFEGADPLPCTADLSRGFYIRPDRRAFKIGAIWPRDHQEFLADPDAEANLKVAGRFMNEKLHALLDRYPALRLGNVTVRPAVYDWTVRDSYPILGATERPGYFVAIGTSGAWFKGAPAIGYAMAALIVTGRSRVKLPRTKQTLDLRAFAPDR